jgi:hypothetical protein
VRPRASEMIPGVIPLGCLLAQTTTLCHQALGSCVPYSPLRAMGLKLRLRTHKMVLHGATPWPLYPQISTHCPDRRTTGFPRPGLPTSTPHRHTRPRGMFQFQLLSPKQELRIFGRRRCWSRSNISKRVQIREIPPTNGCSNNFLHLVRQTPT